LNKEHGLRTFAKKLLWKIFVTKRGKVIGHWRKENNEEFHKCFSSLYKVIHISLQDFNYSLHTNPKRTYDLPCIQYIARVIKSGRDGARSIYGWDKIYYIQFGEGGNLKG
jgi:hypothetical protein